MKIWIMAIGNCEDSGSPLLCATKEIAERELFKARDKLITEWKKADNFAQNSVKEYCQKNNKKIWIEKMYRNMIKALSSNDYEKWDNYPHEKPYIYEIEVLEN